jgi:chromosome segregation ATPase
MQPISEGQPIPAPLSEAWLAQQRSSLEEVRPRLEAALQLFRQAANSLPGLETRLREQDARTQQWRQELEEAGQRILQSMQQTAGGHEKALEEHFQRLQQGAGDLADLRLIPDLQEQVKRLAGAVNNLNRKMIEYQNCIQKLTEDVVAGQEGAHQREQRIWLELDRLHRRLDAQDNAIKKLTEEDASLRGTTAALHGNIMILRRFCDWFTSAAWWRRLFEKP